MPPRIEHRSQRIYFPSLPPHSSSLVMGRVDNFPRARPHRMGIGSPCNSVLPSKDPEVQNSTLIAAPQIIAFPFLEGFRKHKAASLGSSLRPTTFPPMKIFPRYSIANYDSPYLFLLSYLRFSPLKSGSLPFGCFSPLIPPETQRSSTPTLAVDTLTPFSCPPHPRS